MLKNSRSIWTFLLSSLMLLLAAGTAFAGEANIKLPDLTQISFLGGSLSGMTILNIGLIICLIGMIFGIFQYIQTKNLPAHKAMLDVSQTIWETCKTYLFQQGKFLIGLWILIAVCMIYYFGFLEHMPTGSVIIILICVDRRYSWFICCGLVRNPYQHRGQLARRFCFTLR